MVNLGAVFSDYWKGFPLKLAFLKVASFLEALMVAFFLVSSLTFILVKVSLASGLSRSLLNYFTIFLTRVGFKSASSGSSLSSLASNPLMSVP